MKKFKIYWEEGYNYEAGYYIVKSDTLENAKEWLLCRLSNAFGLCKNNFVLYIIFKTKQRCII